MPRRSELPAFAVSLVILCTVNETCFTSCEGAESYRSRVGLLAGYRLQHFNGEQLTECATSQREKTLAVDDASALEASGTAIRFASPSMMATKGPARFLSEPIRTTGEITIEVWLTPVDTKQTGPARIVTLSSDSSHRNFTLGQDGDRIDARLRTTTTGENGVPSLSSKAGTVRKSELTHVVFTRRRDGQAHLYCNGKLSGQKRFPGLLDNWSMDYRFALGNELSGDRPWLGSLHFVAIYNRSWHAEEVQQSFDLGVEGEFESLERLEQKRSKHFFENNVAGILADRCLECHDSTSRKGGLDLSLKETALGQSESGVVLDQSQPLDGLFWTMIESDAMPKGRTPLSDTQKQKIREWLEMGAGWSLQRIDPANYVNGGGVASSVRRLTVPEYINSVKMVTGVDITAEANEALPNDLRADGFRNTAYNLNVDLGHVEAYASLAEKIVDRMDVLKFAKRFSPSQKLTDKSMRGLIEEMGMWIYRGPLAENEIASLRGISTTVASAGGDFEEAVTGVLEAMLQSPRFLYRIERRPQGDFPVAVSQYELATRISFIVWGAPPDRELFELARSGKLHGQVLEQQVERMLDDPLARKRSEQFVTQWLNLDRLNYLSPSDRMYPNWDPALAGDMREETIRCWSELVWRERRPLVDLLHLDYTLATPRLARHYGLKPHEGANPDEWSRYDLSDVPERGGLLTQGSLLTIGGDHASMVTRGLFVMSDLLRGVVKDPPPCVDTTPVPTGEGLTKRDIAESRIADASCGGCHSKFEPLAFGLERFDGIGHFQKRDHHGNRLREDGSILIPGAAEAVSYETSEELFRLLAQSDRVANTLTWKMTQFALGRPLGAADAAAVEEIDRTAKTNGGTYQALLFAIIQSDLVQKSFPEPLP